jgi:hypothetical protein
MELNLNLSLPITNVHEARNGAEFKVNTIETTAQTSSIAGIDNTASKEVDFFGRRKKKTCGLM